MIMKTTEVENRIAYYFLFWKKVKIIRKRIKESRNRAKEQKNQGTKEQKNKRI